MSDKLNTAIVIGSTRDARWGHVAGQWMLKQAKARDELAAELVDLKDFDLPLFNEATSNLWAPSKDERALAWQRKLAGFDAFVVVTAEYNHSVPGALKNAFDQAYKEWMHKPIGFMGYGSVGAARAIEHARMIAIELQMVPVRTAVHLGGADAFATVFKREAIEPVEANLLPAAKDMLDQIVWWGRATKAARAAK